MWPIIELKMCQAKLRHLLLRPVLFHINPHIFVILPSPSSLFVLKYWSKALFIYLWQMYAQQLSPICMPTILMVSSPHAWPEKYPFYKSHSQQELRCPHIRWTYPQSIPYHLLPQMNLFPNSRLLIDCCLSSYLLHLWWLHWWISRAICHMPIRKQFLLGIVSRDILKI